MSFEPRLLPRCQRIYLRMNLGNGCLSGSMEPQWKISSAAESLTPSWTDENRAQIRNRRDSGHRCLGFSEAFRSAPRRPACEDRRHCSLQSRGDCWTDPGNSSEAKNEWRLVDVCSGLEDWDIDCSYVRDLDQPLLCIAADRRGT